MDDLTKRIQDFAIYLPSMQLHSAVRIEGTSLMRENILPCKLKPEDFNYLDPNNQYWHYKWALASAGVFKNEKHGNAITQRNAKSLILGDSGGYQIGTGALEELKTWKKLRNKPQQVIDLWRADTNIKKGIVDWLDLHCDYAMTIDIPLWVNELNKNGKPGNSPFSQCQTKDLINLSVENLQFIQKHRGVYGACKYLNVLQGRTEQDEEDWFNAVRPFKFEGWSLAGGVGQSGGIYRVLRRILLLRDMNLLGRGYDWIHILRLSRIRWAPLVTAIQRGLRKGVNEGITISFDSSSPYRMGGVAAKYAVLNSFGSSLDNDWTIKSFKFPIGYGFANITKRMSLARIHKGYLEAPLDSPIAKLLSIQDMNIRKGEMDIRNIDTFADEVLLNHNVYVFCKAHILANEAVFTSKPTAPQRMMDAVGIIDELFRIEDWHSLLDLKRNVLASVVKDPKKVWK